MKGQTSGLLLGGGTESPLLDTKVYSKSYTGAGVEITKDTIRKVTIVIPPKCIFEIKGQVNVGASSHIIPDAMIISDFNLTELAEYTYNLIRVSYPNIYKRITPKRKNDTTVFATIEYNDINISSGLSELYLYMYYIESGAITDETVSIYYRSISEDNDLSNWSGAAPTVTTITS